MEAILTFFFDCVNQAAQETSGRVSDSLDGILLFPPGVLW